MTCDNETGSREGERGMTNTTTNDGSVHDTKDVLAHIAFLREQERCGIEVAYESWLAGSDCVSLDAGTRRIRRLAFNAGWEAARRIPFGLERSDYDAHAAAIGNPEGVGNE